MSLSAAEERSLKPKIVAGILMVVAVVAPYFFFASSFLGEIRLEIHAVAWQAMLFSDIMRIHSDINATLASFVFLPLRLIFAYEVYQCYQARASRKRAILAGVISELQVIVIYAFATAGSPIVPYASMSAPIPLLLLIGLVFLYAMPPPLPSQQWVEQRTSQPSS